MRDGAYRPMVFMHHGLAVALFMATCAVLAFGLARARERIWGIPMLPVAILISVVLAMSHSLGSLVFVLALAPVVSVLSPRMQVRVAVLLGLLVMFYPMLRAYDWFPTKTLINIARSISADRAGSIDFRFFNEDIALKRALERPIFGWGGFDRIFVYDTHGEEISTLDGAWLITYCQSGVLGFIARFGLLTWPLWRTLRRIRKVGNRPDQLLLSTLAVTTAMVAVDLLPNGMFTYFPHLLAGVLLGASRQMSRRDSAPAPLRQSRQPASPLRSRAPVAARVQQG
jgi:O-antigen ligase